MSFGRNLTIPNAGEGVGRPEQGQTTPEIPERQPPEFELPLEPEAGRPGGDKGSRMLRDKPPEFWNELGGLLRDNGLERARGGDLAKFFAKDPTGQEFVDKWDLNVGQAKQAAKALLGRGDRPEGPDPRDGHDYEGGRPNRGINPDKTYKTPEWMVRQYNLPETIRGSDLVKVQTVLSLGGDEALQASVRAELLGLNLGLEIGGNNFGSTGGLFDGLQYGINPQGVRSVLVTGEPVGTIDGRPVYQTMQGQLVYSTGVPVSAQAQARLVGPDGQPVTGLTPNSQASTGVDGTATSSTGSTTAAASPSPGAPNAGSGLTYNEAAAGTTAPGTPTTPAPTGGVPPTGVDAAAASAAATQVGATTATATGGSRATAAAAGQSNAPGAQFAHNPGGPPPWAPAYGYRGHGGHPAHGEAHGNLGKGLIDGVQQLLSELLGMRVSRGQTQQFVNQLSQAELSAFLANPVQRLPDVMPTLMNVVMRDHGRPDRAGRTALLALFDHVMSRNPSAREIYNFFKSLTPDQIEHLIVHRAEMIGNLPGVPQEVRVAANVQRIEAELTVMQGSRDPAAQRRAQTLEHLLAQNAQILHFDNAPDGRLAAGRISQVFGNLAEAKYVGLMIPGLNNTMDNFSARAERGQLLHQLAQPMVREGTAMVVWLERLGQEVLRQYRSMLTAWQAREQQTTRAPMTFQQALAQAARHLAQESVPGMMLRGDARMTFVGHSFGSLIAKEALNQGAKPDACVFLGMPEHRLKKIGAQAGCGDVDLYSMVADGDTMDEAVAADEAPEAADAAGLDEEIDRLDPGKDLVPPIEAVLDPHDNYGLEGSASLAQIVGVTLGWRPKLLPPEPSVITLYRSADGTYEGQAEPVGWFGPKGEEW